MPAANPFVSTDWLATHLSAPDLVVVDASWHLPNLGRDAKAEYLAAHIPGAIHFDTRNLFSKLSRANRPHVTGRPPAHNNQIVICHKFFNRARQH